MGETMRSLYEELVTVHKEVFHLQDMQQKCKDNSKALKVVHTSIVFVHEWSMQYKESLPELAKKTMQHAELEKAQMWMIIQSNKKLAWFIANIHSL